MSTNEQLFRSLIEDGFGKEYITIFNRYASPDFVEHQYGIVPPNVEGVKKTIRSLHRAFSDFSMTVEDITSDGDKVWGRMTARGTQTGQFGPMPPTGKKIEITVIDIMRFSEGKLVEHWGVADRFALMDQFGLKPPPKVIMKIMSLFR
jgi:predicted ester cyclase